MFYHATATYRPSVGAEPTQFNTLCSSFITCSISSDFIGGLEYWPESSPCPSLALAGRNNSNYYSIPSQTGVYLSLCICPKCFIHACPSVFTQRL